MLDPLQLGPDALDDRQKHCVEQQHTVFGMIDDIDELLVEQTWVHRVEHPAHSRAAVPADEMVAMVHRERRDAVALFHSQLHHRGGEPACICSGLAPGRSRHAAVGPARDDLASGMLARGMVDQARHEQRLALHSHRSGILDFIVATRE